MHPPGSILQVPDSPVMLVVLYGNDLVPGRLVPITIVSEKPHFSSSGVLTVLLDKQSKHWYHLPGVGRFEPKALASMKCVAILQEDVTLAVSNSRSLLMQFHVLAQQRKQEQSEQS